MSKSVHRRLSKMPASLRRQAIMFGVGEFGAGAGRSATALAALGEALRRAHTTLTEYLASLRARKVAR